MAAKYKLETKIGDIGVFEKSIVIPGIDNIYIKNVTQDELCTLAKIINDIVEKSYLCGRKSLKQNIKNLLDS